MLAVLQNVNDYWNDWLRTALTSFSCEAVGGTFETALDVSVMFALISAGFGIHDDIIDKTSKKHFRKTVPNLFGVDRALLAGDLLILKASKMFETIIPENQPVRIKNIMKVYGSLYIEICEAEFMELSIRGTLDIELEDYQRILWKSAADTEACSRIGAILGNGSKQEVNSLAHFGRRMGFYQRLLDDLRDTLNIEGNLPERLTKERIPLPILYAAKSSKNAYTTIQSLLAKTAITPEETKQLLAICFKTNAFAFIKEIANRNSREAISYLNLVKPSSAREMLALINRKSLTDLCSLCL